MSATMDEIRLAARRVFRTDQGATAFLGLPNKQLGGVPKKLVEQGRGDEVLAFLKKLEHDAPAPPSDLANLFRGWLGPFGGKR